jgi:hypothetical protein
MCISVHVLRTRQQYIPPSDVFHNNIVSYCYYMYMYTLLEGAAGTFDPGVSDLRVEDRSYPYILLYRNSS